MILRDKIRLLIKRLLYPGLDLHTHSRYRHLPQFFISGQIETLDAGCGNGALSYAAFKKGNNVFGVSNSPLEIQRTSLFFKAYEEHGLRFRLLNLYQLLDLNCQFDQIICSETLEHIKDDRLIIKYFHRLLRPNGILHLCCPHSLHPKHNVNRMDVPEDGGHVRDGYTMENYQHLLESSGFKITDKLGLGTKTLVFWDTILRNIQSHFGDLMAAPLFIILWPFIRFMDKPNPSLPFSIYVKAIKIS